MVRKSFSGSSCSVARSLEEVGEWWSLLIVREATQGAHRFDDFLRALGIARNILATRLERLVELEILERFPLPDRANTDGYRLTTKGEDLYPVIVSLLQWGDRWLAPDCKPSTVLIEDTTGAPIERIVVRAEGGLPLSFRDIRFLRGPGASSITETIIEARNQKVIGHGRTIAHRSGPTSEVATETSDRGDPRLRTRMPASDATTAVPTSAKRKRVR